MKRRKGPTGNTESHESDLPPHTTVRANGGIFQAILPSLRGKRRRVFGDTVEETARRAWSVYRSGVVNRTDFATHLVTALKSTH